MKPATGFWFLAVFPLVPLAFFKEENEAEAWIKSKIEERAARLRALRAAAVK